MEPPPAGSQPCARIGARAGWAGRPARGGGRAMVSARAYAVLLATVPGIGPASYRRLLERFEGAQAAWLASATELAAAGLDRKTVERLLALRARLDPDVAWRRLEALGGRVIAIEEA